jgi:trigger factor
VSLEVKVTDIREKVLPELTDEWASDASEFDTVAELRDDIVKRSTLMKKVQATMALRNGTVEALVELVDTDPPKPLVDSEVERRAHDLGHRLEAQGATIAQYIEATGQNEEQIVADLRAQAVPAVKADLALRAVAEAEKIEPTDDEMEAEIGRLAASYQLTPEDLRSQLERAEQIPAVRSDLKKSKALEWLIEQVEVVDADGQAVDRALLTLVPDTDETEAEAELDAIASAPEESEAPALPAEAQPAESREA